MTTDNSSATTVPRMHSPGEHIIPLPSTYQALPPQLWQQPQMAIPDKLQRSPVIGIIHGGSKRVQGVLEYCDVDKLV